MKEIAKLLFEIEAKIDNFLGFEELTDEEREAIAKLREAIKKGEFIILEGLFSECISI